MKGAVEDEDDSAVIGRRNFTPPRVDQEKKSLPSSSDPSGGEPPPPRRDPLVKPPILCDARGADECRKPPPKFASSPPADEHVLLREKASELIALTEPLKELTNRVPEEIYRPIKALLFRLDPFIERVLNVVEDESSLSPRCINGNTIKEASDNVKSSATRVADSEAPSSSDIPPSKGASDEKTRVVFRPPAKAPPPPAPKVTAKASDPAAKSAPRAKKPAPPKKKNPPPQRPVGQQFPASTGPGSVKDRDEALLPEVVPSSDLIPKQPVAWQGVNKSQAGGTIWESLLAEDKNREPARKLYARLVVSEDDMLMRSPAPTIRPKSAATGVRPPEVGNAPTVGSDDGASRNNTKWPSFRFEVNFDELDRLFFERVEDKAQRQNQRVPTLADDAAAAAKNRPTSVLPPSMIQCIEIGLTGFGLLDFDQLKHAYKHLLFEKPKENINSPTASTPGFKSSSGGPEWYLTLERLEWMYKNYPSKEYPAKLRELQRTTSPGQTIARADRFLLAVMSIPKFQQMTNTLITRLSFEKEMGTLEKKSRKLDALVARAVQAVNETGGTFTALFALIVKMGNYINYRTRKSPVYGIAPTALDCLKNQRSIDGSRSLLKVVAEHIEDQFPLAWQDLEWLLSCQEVFCPDDLRAQMEDLKTRLKLAQANQEDPEIEAFCPAFREFVASFLPGANERVEQIETFIARIKKNLKEFLSKLGALANPNDPVGKKEDLVVFEKLASFAKDLFQCQRELQQERAQAEKRRLKSTTSARRLQSFAASRRESFSTVTLPSATTPAKRVGKRGTTVVPLLSADVGTPADLGKIPRPTGDNATNSSDTDSKNGGRRLSAIRTPPKRGPQLLHEQAGVHAGPPIVNAGRGGGVSQSVLLQRTMAAEEEEMYNRGSPEIANNFSNEASFFSPSPSSSQPGNNGPMLNALVSSYRHPASSAYEDYIYSNARAARRPRERSQFYVNTSNSRAGTPRQRSRISAGAPVGYPLLQDAWAKSQVPSFSPPAALRSRPSAYLRDIDINPASYTRSAAYNGHYPSAASLEQLPQSVGTESGYGAFVPNRYPSSGNMDAWSLQGHHQTTPRLYMRTPNNGIHQQGAQTPPAVRRFYAANDYFDRSTGAAENPYHRVYR